MIDTFPKPIELHPELTILGAMLLDGNALQDATETLQVGDMATESNRIVYRAILDVLQDGMGVDLITVGNRLKQDKRLQTIGGEEYLFWLTEGIPRNPKIESYVRIVKARSLASQANGILQSSMARLQDGADSPQTVISDTEAALRATLHRTQEEQTLSGQVVKMVEGIMRRRTGEQKSFVRTGLEEIDFTHGGFGLGEMTIIAARPRVGKSTILRQAVMTICSAGDHVHLFTPEMSTDQVLQICVSIESGVPFSRIRHAGSLTDADMKSIIAASGTVERWPLTIDDSAPIRASDIISRARSVKRRNNTRLVGVDYLQKVKHDGKMDQRHVAITDALVDLAALAKAENIAVVAISSLTEPSGKDANRVPTLEDLRGSGDIRYEANTVIILHRELHEATQKLVPETKIIFGKARSDADGLATIYFDPKFVRFVGKQAFLGG